MQTTLIFDSHFHLNLMKYPEENIKNALENGVVGGLCAGVWPTDFNSFYFPDHSYGIKIQFAKKDEKNIWSTSKFLCFLALGLHPEFLARHWLDSQGNVLQKKIENDLDLFHRVIDERNEFIWAIGETGFDLSKDALQAAGPNVTKEKLLDLQAQSFDFCIEMSAKFQLPLIVHSRSAWAVTLKKLNEAKVKGCPGIMIHCYSGPAEEMKILEKLGIYCSFGGVTTWKTAKKARRAFELCAPHLRLVETDSPDLSPEFSNGEKKDNNEPANLSYIAEYLSKVSGISYANFCQQMNENFKKYLGLNPSFFEKIKS